MANSLAAQIAALAKTDKNTAALLAAALGLTGSKGPQKKAKGKTARPKATESTDERKALFAAAVVKAGEKAGFTNVVPNETMLTYGKWEERGMTVKKGQKAIRVKTAGMNGKGIPLFHKDQVEPINAAPVEDNSAVTADGEVERSPQLN